MSSRFNSRSLPLRVLLLAGVAIAAVAPAHAQSQPAPSAANWQALQDRVEELSAQVDDLKRSSGNQYADLSATNAAAPRLTLANGRPTFATADGAFTASLRVLVQDDYAYYSQGGNLGSTPAAPVDLSSGNNIRRARLGLEGTFFTDWSYNLLLEFGGSGTESAGTISQAYVEYGGLAPVYFRVGIYPPNGSLEDSVAASDLLFLERAQPTDVARSIAGADGRAAASIFAYDTNYYVGVNYTGGVVGDAVVADEQQAVTGRAVYRLFSNADANLVVGFNGSYVFKVADTATAPVTSPFAGFRERPELNVDGTRLVNAGNIDAKDVWQWGIEAAGNYKSLYGQGGYFGFGADRRASALPSPDFDGWYVQGSWILTGEVKPWAPARGAYGAPRPAQPFSLSNGGIGAWELTGRYSVLDLDYRPGIPGAATPVGGIRGGEQKIITAGINWYPNNALRFVLDYQHADIDRLNGVGANIGGKVDAIALRTQISL